MRGFKKYPVLHVFLAIWLMLASIYTIYAFLSFVMFKPVYNMGVRNTVNRLIIQSKDCVPIPVNSGDVTVKFISLNCLNAPLNTKKDEKIKKTE